MKGNIKNILLVLSCILTSLLMVSTATALPVASSEPVMDLVEEQEQILELKTTIENIINSDCSLSEKKEGLLQLINDLKLNNNPQSTSAFDPMYLILILFFLLSAPITYYLMYDNPTVYIPINIALSVFLAVLEIIYAIENNELSNIFEYIPYFIEIFVLGFIFGIPFNLVMILEAWEALTENRDILSDKFIAEANLLPLKKHSIQPYPNS